jgi:hypothetical protein
MSPISIVLLAALSFSPTSDYEAQQIEGWKVYVNKDLMTDQVEIGRKALELLRIKLYDISRVVPERPLAKMREIPIWLEHNNDAKIPCACYHPDAGWLKGNDFNPEKEKSVEICSAQRFLDWSKAQPSMILHELAHGYHHRELTWEEPRILAAFEKAKQDGQYASVLHIHGKQQSAYAITNHHEYFAEASEAYFGTNDFFPFVRPELERHDPEGFKVLKEIWGE